MFQKNWVKSSSPYFAIHAIKVVNISDAFYLPAALAWMVTCAVVPYLVFAFPQSFFTTGRYTDDYREN